MSEHEIVSFSAAHSWGYADEHDSQIGFFDEREGLRVWMLQYRPSRDEIDFTIPIELVPALIRHLIRFSTSGEIAKQATNLGYKADLT